MNFLNDLIELTKNTFNKEVIDYKPLPRSGSQRKYFRLTLEDNQTVIGVYNDNFDENMAFIQMTKHFTAKKLNVPQLYAYDLKKNIYILQDLGNELLVNHIQSLTGQKDFQSKIFNIYQQILRHLYQFQVQGADYDWNYTFPVPKFDRTAYLFDLNYFKYNVLKYSKVNFHELKLQQDFEKLIEFILTAEHKFFCYRDFQSRNIMVYGEQFYFIDYQGGRQGNLFYDLASLLYDSHAIWFREESIRSQLVRYYFELSKDLHQLSEIQFFQYFYVNALIRKLQALAAHYLRGLVEKKLFFIPSIPKNITEVLQLINLQPVNLPHLRYSLIQLQESVREQFDEYFDIELEINSFGYKKGGYPPDSSDNNGGFVIDCRLLPNPYHIPELSDKTGLEREVQQYLDSQPIFEEFIGKFLDIIYLALKQYRQKGYTRLQINFGCTGGVHRSVYCAEKVAYYLSQLFKVRRIVVNHLELGQSRVLE